MKVQDSDGHIRTIMIEIKPYSQTQSPPTNPKRKTKSWLYSVHTYVTNMAKWEAAKSICEDRGWEFQIITEYELGLKKRK